MRADTEWFKNARWGVFMHFLAERQETVESWNKKIDGFNVKKLVEQLVAVKAKYFFLTLGQNSGFFLSPNAAYDSLVKRSPSRLSRRDLIADIISELEPTGIRMMVYLSSHAPADDQLAVEGLQCTPKWDASAWCLRPGRYLVPDESAIDERLTAFQRNWEAIIREWSLRWGKSVHGWWFDGCYYADKMYRNSDEPNFKSFASAVKAGNPQSLVAFNPGVKVPVISHSEYEDYTAGEINSALPAYGDDDWNRNITPFIDGARYHLLGFLGRSWGSPEPRFPMELVVGYTKYINSFDGVITWDIGPNPDGTISEKCFEQLLMLGKVLG
jgi:alpha-L-fucosidase